MTGEEEIKTAAAPSQTPVKSPVSKGAIEKVDSGTKMNTTSSNSSTSQSAATTGAGVAPPSPIKPQTTAVITQLPSLSVPSPQHTRKTSHSAPSTPLRNYFPPASPASTTSKTLQVSNTNNPPPLVPNIDNPAANDGSSSSTANSSSAMEGSRKQDGEPNPNLAVALGLQVLERQAEEMERRRVKQTSNSSAPVKRPSTAPMSSGGNVQRANPFDESLRNKSTASPQHYFEHHPWGTDNAEYGGRNRGRAQDGMYEGDVPATVHVEDAESISTINRDIAVTGGDGKPKKINRVDSFGKFLRTPIKHSAKLTRSISNKVKGKSNKSGDSDSNEEDEGTLKLSTPLYSGYLHKRGRHGKWQKRWFETDGKSLFYFKTNERLKLLATLDLLKVGSISLDKSDTLGRTFLIQVANRDYYLQANSRELAIDWIICMQRVREARMEVGNLKLVRPDSFSSNALDSKGEDDDYALKVVMLASRQRTKGLGQEEFNQFENMGDDSEDVNQNSAPGFTMAPTPTSGSDSLVSSKAASAPLVSASVSAIRTSKKRTDAVIERWTKKRSSLQNLTRRLSRWARRMTMLRCVIKDDVVHQSEHQSEHHQYPSSRSLTGAVEGLNDAHTKYYNLHEGNFRALNQISEGEGDQSLMLQDSNTEEVHSSTLDQKPKGRPKTKRRDKKDKSKKAAKEQKQQQQPPSDPSAHDVDVDSSSGRESPTSNDDSSSAILCDASTGMV